MPAILIAPHAGIFIWCWISYMNPHRMTWGFANQLPMLDAVAGLTVIAWLTSKERKLPPAHPILAALILFFIWTCITTLFASLTDLANLKWSTFAKIILFTLFTTIFVTSQQRLRYMIYIILISLSLFSIKGGLFTILHGGHYIVFGPTNSFLEDNNQLALAFLTIVPLFFWTYKHGEHAIIRYAGLGTGILTLISVLGSHSRGAIVALAAMAAWAMIVAKRWVLGAFLSIGIIGGALLFMPEAWVERMTGISAYEEDQSASTRLTMWKYATNVAKASPIIGRGFNFFFDRSLAELYMPGSGRIFVGHSIYFDTLGEHGFVGLYLYLLLFSCAIITTQDIKKLTKGHEEAAWAYDLAQMLQFSLVGFAVAGAFLSLTIFDLYYHILALTMMLHVVNLKQLAPEQKQRFSLDDLRAPTRLPRQPAQIGPSRG